MKVPYLKMLGASLALALLGLSAQAQTGIGTTTPRSMLDVNGAISVAETTAGVTGNAATIPTGFSLVRLTGGASAAVTLTAAASPVPVAGQLLTINNTTTFPATFSGQTIAAGQTLSLVYSNGSWQGTAGGIGNATTGITASNGLTKTGNNIALGGALTGATDVATAGNNLTFSGTGKVGIGTTTPVQSLDVTGTGLFRNGGSSTSTTGNEQLLFGYSGTATYQHAIKTRHNSSGPVGNSLDFYTWNSGTDATATIGTKQVMTLDGNGYVGIGTAVPATNLEVVATSASASTIGTNTQLRLTRPTVPNTKYANVFDLALGSYATGVNAQSRLDFNLTNGPTNTPDVNVLSLLGNGNVGIGTATPNAPLQFASTTANRKIVLWEGANNDHQFFGLGINNSTLRYQVNSTSDNHVFYAGTGTTTSTELMRINGTGNVGIGTASPSALLDVNGTTRLRGLTTAGLVTTDASGNLSSVTTASLNPTTASNGLTKTGNDIALGGTLTQATTVTQGNNNLTFSTGTTGTGVLVLDGQGIAGSTTNTAKQRIEFTSSADPNAAIGHTVATGTGTSEISDLYMYSGNDSQTNQDRIRLVGENILFQSFNNAGTSTLANAEANSGTITNMFIGASGSVGIGTATPAALLDVNGSTRLRGLTTAGVVTTDANGNLSSATAASLNATTASNGLTKTGNNIALGGALTGATDVATAGNNLTFSGTGNVGIGTTTPNAPLQLANTPANRKIVLWEDTNNNHEYYGFGINAFTLRYQVAGASANHVFYAGSGATTSTELMRITGTGNVGIGTSSPNGTLHVVGTTSNTLHLQGVTHVPNAVNSTLVLDTFGASIGSNLATKITGQDDGGGGGILNLVTSSTNRVTILNNGNAGIGTSAPSALLDVNGTTRLRGLTTAGVVTTDANGNLSSASAASLNPTTASNGLTKTGNNIVLGGTLTGATDVATAGNNLTFSGTGKVGIGTTTPVQSLDVTGTGLFRNGGVSTATTGNEQLVFGFGGGANFQHAIKTRHNGGAPDGNALDFYTWNYGTDAVTTIGTNRVMTLDGSGKVGIGLGTTTPTQSIDAIGTARLRGLTTAGVVTTDASGNLSSVTTASLNPTTASNGLTKTGNDIALGGTLTQATTVTQGNNNLTFSTGTTGTGVLVLDGQGIAGSTTNTAKQRIEFTSSADPNAAIGHTVATGTGTSEISDLYMYSGNDSQTNQDRIRLVGENILFQSFNNAGTSTLANAEANSGTITNMFIGASGSVGIGNTSPAAPLDVTGNAIVRGILQVITTPTAPVCNIFTQTAAIGTVPAGLTVVYDVGGITENHVFGGNVVPITDNLYSLGLAADRWSAVYAANGTIQTSDLRLKTNIVNSGYGLGTVMKMRPVTYNWKTSPTTNHMVGFVAQEMELLVPEAVDTPQTATGYYGMKYNQLIPVLTSAIQEQQAEIEALKAANTGLKAELKAANTGLKAELKASLDGKASASTMNEMQTALQSLRAEMQTLKAGTTTASK